MSQPLYLHTVPRWVPFLVVCHALGRVGPSLVLHWARLVPSLVQHRALGKLGPSLVQGRALGKLGPVLCSLCTKFTSFLTEQPQHYQC